MELKCNLDDLNNTGVYLIRNLINNKIYVGSASVSLLKRMLHHQAMLRNNKHKNIYLQRSFNKHGDKNFSFEILELCKKEYCLKVEQYWMDYHQSHNLKKVYNINPKATNVPSTDRLTIDKRRNTVKLNYKLGKYTHGFKKGNTPWNKGKDSSVISYDYLKGIPKTITDNVITARKKLSEKQRTEVYPEIYVYDIDYNFLGKWRSAKDLEIWSLTEHNNLPIKSRFKNERMGKPINFLQSCNINKSCTYKKPYKNLRFFTQPLNEVIH